MSRGKHLQSKVTGFTIVELLIVVVVIAILAAITIVAYNGIANRAKESAAESTASQAMRKIMADAVLKGDVYTSDITSIGLVDANGIKYQYTLSADNKGFCVTATNNDISAFTAKSFSYNSGTVLDQSTATIGACPGHSAGSGALITNMIPNPSFETAGYTGWIGSAASLATSPLNATSGATSLRATNSGTGSTGDARLSTGSLTSFAADMEAGKTYTMSARVTIPVSPTGGYTRAPGILLWYSTNGTSWTNEVPGPKAPIAAGAYTVSYTFTLPSNATGALLGLGAASSTASQQFFYDSIILTEGSTVYNFADGSTPGWIWTGTVGNSVSRGSAQ